MVDHGSSSELLVATQISSSKWHVLETQLIFQGPVFHFHDCGMKSKSRNCKYLVETSVQIDCFARLNNHQEGKIIPFQMGINSISFYSLWRFLVTVFGDLLLSSRSRHAKRIHCVLQYGQSDVVQAAVEEVFNPGLWASLSFQMVWYIITNN